MKPLIKKTVLIEKLPNSAMENQASYSMYENSYGQKSNENRNHYLLKFDDTALFFEKNVYISPQKSTDEIQIDFRIQKQSIASSKTLFNIEHIINDDIAYYLVKEFNLDVAQTPEKASFEIALPQKHWDYLHGLENKLEKSSLLKI